MPLQETHRKAALFWDRQFGIRFPPAVIVNLSSLSSPMRMPLFCLAFAMLSSSAVASAPLTLTPQAISLDIESNGVRATVQKLISGKRPRPWEAVLQKVKTGNPDWLGVAKQLAAGTDAGTSEALQVALATALPKNPSGVLKLAGTQSFLSLEDICGAPFIEPDPTFLRRYLARTRRALNDVKDPMMEQQRTKCLAEIEKAISEEFSSNRSIQRTR